MSKKNKSFKRALTAVLKTTFIMAFFAAVFVFASVGACADPTTVITVMKDGETVKDFSMEELQQIAADEGGKTYIYSSWSNIPEFRTYSDIEGPTVKGILDKAGVLNDVGDKCVVSFTSAETVSLTGKQLLTETRYYYQNGGLVDHANGVIPPSAKDGAAEVPAVIGIGNGAGDNGLLCVGQTEPAEENDELFITGLVSETSPGVIEVSTKDAGKCSSVTVADPKPGTITVDGTEVTFGDVAAGEKICYTFDKNASPGFGGPIYNYGTGEVCKPVLSGDGARLTIKTRVKCYGKQDSSLQTFTFSVGNALTVTINGETAKAYHTADDVISGFNAETFSYSGYNTFPSLSFKKNVEGIRVESIIRDATGKNVSDFGGNSTISFTGSDGYTSVFTVNQLFGSERYYFPNAASGTNSTGGKATPAAYAEKQPVPAIIGISGDNTLLFGQIAPNEQNFPQCVDYMLDLAFIDISTAPAPKCAAPAPVIASGSIVGPGTVITFPFPAKANARDKLYYIVDPAPGEIPGPGDSFYYYAAFHWPAEMINPPVLSTYGKHTVRTVLTAYGKQDSPVTDLTYYVTPVLGKPTLKLKAGKKKITVKWSEVSGASGYIIYRSTKKTKGYKAVKTVDSGSTVSFVNKKLKKGKKYYYKVIAYRTVGDIMVYGDYSAVKNSKAK